MVSVVINFINIILLLLPLYSFSKESSSSVVLDSASSFVLFLPLFAFNFPGPDSGVFSNRGEESVKG